MPFHSFQYLLFFPIVSIIYIVLPGKMRCIWLLAASLFFYYSADARYLPLLLALTLFAWIGGIGMEQARQRQKDRLMRLVFVLSIVCELGILCYFKYTGFLLDNLQHAAAVFRTDTLEAAQNILPPLGISFLVFQTVSYAADVYRQTIPAEKNILRFACYVSFFPKVTSGPIERAGSILGQLTSTLSPCLTDLKEGLSMVLMGLFLKLVLSDNIGAVINPVFASWQDYTGLQIGLAVVLFAFQIYGDFGGYSYIAIGSARMLGIRLSDNFAAPYHAESVSEFWTRWHITLNTWLRDYLYIPLGGNRKGTFRKYINTMIVFLLSGLWHGADWTFVIWGGLNGVYIIAEAMMKKAASRAPGNRAGSAAVKEGTEKFLPVQDTTAERYSTHLRRRIMTFILVDFAWLFFCMPDLASAFGMIRHAVTQPGIRELFNLGFLDLFPDMKTFAVILLSLICFMGIDTMIYRKKISFTDFFFRQSSAFRWLTGIVVLGIIIFFGAYGDAYEQTQFIYFQF